MSIGVIGHEGRVLVTRMANADSKVGLGEHVLAAQGFRKEEGRRTQALGAIVSGRTAMHQPRTLAITLLYLLFASGLTRVAAADSLWVGSAASPTHAAALGGHQAGGLLYNVEPTAQGAEASSGMSSYGQRYEVNEVPNWYVTKVEFYFTNIQRPLGQPLRGHARIRSDTNLTGINSPDQEVAEGWTVFEFSEPVRLLDYLEGGSVRVVFEPSQSGHSHGTIYSVPDSYPGHLRYTSGHVFERDAVLRIYGFSGQVPVLYVLRDNPSRLLLLDSSTADTIQALQVDVPNLAGLAYDPRSRRLFSVAHTNPAGELISIDPMSGSAVAIGPVGLGSELGGRVTDMTFGRDSRLYALTTTGGEHRLVAIDTTTGAGALQQLSDPTLRAIAYQPVADILFAANDSELFQLDAFGDSTLAAGAADLHSLAAVPGSADLYALRLTGNPAETELIRFDPIAQAGTVVGPIQTTTGEAIVGIASAADIAPSQGHLIGDVSTSRPTVVITHGWQLCGEFTGFPPDWTADMRDEILQRIPAANVLIYSWPEAYTCNPLAARAYAEAHGSHLAGELVSRLGASYTRAIHLIGHSLGTIVNASAAATLAERTNLMLSQFTLLDYPLPLGYTPSYFHRHLEEGRVAWVDNYYGSLAAPLPATGSSIPGAAPSGGLSLAADHAGVRKWYHDSIAGIDQGFAWSAIWGSPLRPPPQTWLPDALHAVVVELLVLASLSNWTVDVGDVTEVLLSPFQNYELPIRLSQSPSSTPMLRLRESDTDAAVSTAISIPEDADFLRLTYTWENVGDGDWLSLWFGGTHLASLAPSLEPGTREVVDVPVKELQGRTARLQARLHRTGFVNADLLLGGLEVIRDPNPGSFFTVTPCRLYDSRSHSVLQNGEQRLIPTSSSCNLPPTARALSVNITVVNPSGPGHVKLFPAASAVPQTSVLNFGSGQTRANNAIAGVAFNHGGLVAQFVVAGGGSAHLIVDVNGYFE